MLGLCCALVRWGCRNVEGCGSSREARSRAIRGEWSPRGRMRGKGRTGRIGGVSGARGPSYDSVGDPALYPKSDSVGDSGCGLPGEE